MQDFIITQKNNIWWGMFPRLMQAGFGNAAAVVCMEKATWYRVL